MAKAQIVEYSFPAIGSYHALRGNPDGDIRRYKGLLIESSPKLLIFPSYQGGMGVVFREGSKEHPAMELFLVAPSQMTYSDCGEDLLVSDSPVPKKFIREVPIDDEFVDAMQGIVANFARNQKAEARLATIFRGYSLL